MSINNQNFVQLDIGLSKEDQTRIEKIRSLKIGGKSLGEYFRSFSELNLMFTKVKLKDKVTFFELLSVMINAGVPLIRSLYVLADQTQNKKLGDVIRQCAKKMEEGAKFSQALAIHDNIFTEAEIGMIASGEASGNLNEILRDISHQAEKSANIVAKVKGAMIYPAAIVFIMIVAVFLMMTLVIPKLTEIFAQGGQELPTSTKILVYMSGIASNHYIMVIAAAILLVLAFLGFKSTKSGRYFLNYLILILPIFGVIVKKLMISRFARLLASLLKSGVPIIKSLEITANAIGNEMYKKRIKYAAQDVAQGIPLGENLTESEGLFPPMVSSMILVGERTANIVEVSNKIADYYESEVDNAVASMSKLMEPIILVAMGVSVGFIVAAIMQPIIALSDITTSL